MLNRGTQPLSDSRITQLVADRDDARQMAAARTATYDVVVDVSGTEPAHMRHLPLPADVSRYVFISSAVYSRKSVTPPFREDDQANGDAIWGGYGEAKATCERLLHEALPEWSPHRAAPALHLRPAQHRTARTVPVGKDGGRPADLRAGRWQYPDPVSVPRGPWPTRS